MDIIYFWGFGAIFSFPQQDLEGAQSPQSGAWTIITVKVWRPNSSTVLSGGHDPNETGICIFILWATQSVTDWRVAGSEVITRLQWVCSDATAQWVDVEVCSGWSHAQTSIPTEQTVASCIFLKWLVSPILVNLPPIHRSEHVRIWKTHLLS